MDKIEKFQETVIHHGKHNDRLYFMKFPGEGDLTLIKQLTKKAQENGYSKIIGKIPKKLLPVFLRNGYKIESTIPRFYKGIEDCCFVSKFLTKERAVFDPKPLERFNEVLNNYDSDDQTTVENSFEMRALSQTDAENMTVVFKQVFATYPFPVHEADYIRETMEDNIAYFGLMNKGELISISSAEMDIEGQNAEMTDFAVLPSFRGRGLSKLLLAFMEGEMKKRGIKTLYTIARLKSIPMNKTFLGAGYSYGGTLINNTNIAGGIESMNILYKYI